MAECSIYFGTKDYMRWIKGPNSGMGMNRVGWSANGTYLNGGGWSRSSTTTHFEPSLTWSFLTHTQVREIQDFYYGAHGQGPFYWLDPFSMGTNVLPVHWSIPRLAADDAPPLVRGRRPTLSTTAPNNNGLPSQTATYELRIGDEFDSLWIPCPENFAVHVAAWGTNTNTAAIMVAGTDVTLTPVSRSFPTWTSFDGLSGVDMTLVGSGFLSLAGIVVQVLPVGEGVPKSLRFLSGAGHSGCVFKTPPVSVGYSAPDALDYQSLTADFIEVGSWQQ